MDQRRLETDLLSSNGQRSNVGSPTLDGTDRRGAELAAPRLQRDFAQAFGALAGVGVGYLLDLGHEVIDRENYQEVHGSCRDDKCQEGIQQVSVQEFAAVDFEEHVGKVRQL